MAAVNDLLGKTKLKVERARARYGAVDVAVRTFKRFSEDDGGVLAAALTYYTFFSLFPILLFSASLLGYLSFLNPDVKDAILEAGFEAFPLLASTLDVEGLAALEARRGMLALAAGAMALYAGSGAIVALGHALNRIDHNPQERNFLGKRLVSLKLLAGLGAMALTSLAIGTTASYASGLFGLTGALSKTLAFLLGHALGTAAGVALFVAVFVLLPAKRKSWRRVLPGAIVVGIAFELLKIVGPWYLERGGAARSATFGAFAAAAGLLVASYLLAQITLLGAELNAVLAERRRTRQSSMAVN